LHLLLRHHTDLNADNYRWQLPAKHEPGWHASCGNVRTLHAFVATSDHTCSPKILFFFGLCLRLGIAAKLRLNGTGPDL
jgi:hypothetical protein